MVREIVIDSAFLRFGEREVLRGAHLRLRRGTVTGLLGRNGCGKSCLLKMLTGQLSAQHAYVGVDGEHQPDLYAVPGLLNYLPQRTVHPPALRLAQLVEYYRIPAAAFWTTAATTIFPDPTIRMGTLSGGQQRLFETLLVLAADTAFTLLDEPFSHIMPVHIDYLREIISTARRRKGILVTDHQYRHVLDLSDELYLLYSGTTRIIKAEKELVQYGYIKESRDR